MNWKCAIGASIGAPAIIAAIVGLFWLMVKYDWIVIVLLIILGLLLLLLFWIVLYEFCKKHSKQTGFITKRK